MALVWLEFVYFEAPELKREATNLDTPLGIGSLAYTGATCRSTHISKLESDRTSRSFDEYRTGVFLNFDGL